MLLVSSIYGKYYLCEKCNNVEYGPENKTSYDKLHE